jgi:cystathionine beta-lyase
MDFSAPEPVVEALRERAEHGIFGYTSPPEDLGEAVRAWLRRRHGWEVEQEAISFVPGVMRGVNSVARAVGRPGDGILVQPPVYFPFLVVPENSERVLEQAPVRPVNGRYQIDFDAFEQAITDRTRLFLLCNPHNPLGRVFTTMELERLAEICLRRNIVISSDEIHGDLIFNGHKHIPIAALAPEIAAKTVTTFAPSKTFNMGTGQSGRRRSGWRRQCDGICGRAGGLSGRRGVAAPTAGIPAGKSGLYARLCEDPSPGRRHGSGGGDLSCLARLPLFGRLSFP